MVSTGSFPSLAGGVDVRGGLPLLRTGEGATVSFSLLGRGIDAIGGLPLLARGEDAIDDVLFLVGGENIKGSLTFLLSLVTLSYIVKVQQQIYSPTSLTGKGVSVFFLPLLAESIGSGTSGSSSLEDKSF